MDLYSLISNTILVDHLTLPCMELIRRINQDFRQLFLSNRELLDYIGMKFYSKSTLNFKSILESSQLKWTLREAVKEDLIEIVKVIIPNPLREGMRTKRTRRLPSTKYVDLASNAAESRSPKVFSYLIGRAIKDYSIASGICYDCREPMGSYTFPLMINILESCNASIYQSFFDAIDKYEQDLQYVVGEGLDTIDDVPKTDSYAYIYWKLIGNSEPYDIIHKRLVEHFRGRINQKWLWEPKKDTRDIDSLLYTQDLEFLKYLLENDYTKDELLDVFNKKYIRSGKCVEYLVL